MSASVSMRYLGPPACIVRVTPWLTAASLPVQPAASGAARSTSSRSPAPCEAAAARAASAVPSVEPSSTRITRKGPA